MVENTYKGWDPEGIVFRIKIPPSVANRVFGRFFYVPLSRLQDDLSKTK